MGKMFKHLRGVNTKMLFDNVFVIYSLLMAKPIEKMFTGKIESLLEFLQPFQENLKNLDKEGTFKPEEILEEYRNWLRLLKQLEHPLEKEFFRQEWVPIITDDLCVFIDLRDEDMAIFETNYFFYEPYQWYRINLFDNISELIDNIKDSEKLKGFYERFKKRDIDMFHKLCVENGVEG